MMNFLRPSILAVAFASFEGCKEDAPADGPIPCTIDGDCPGPACGPCVPGEVITRNDLNLNCKIDPCVDGGAVCGAAGVCVVHPGAKMRSSVRAAARRDEAPTPAAPAPKEEPRVDPNIVAGFELARARALRCPGIFPGLKITIRVFCDEEGKVIAAVPIRENARLPVATCVAKAVKSRARFVTTPPVRRESFVYEF